MPNRDRPTVYARLLDFIGLASFERRLAGKLSGGMKQKLGLACALIGRPRVLLLDEPTVGVDPLSRRELWRMVSDLASDGIAVLWSTGYLDEAERCAELLLLDRGRQLYAGPPSGFSGRAEGCVWTVRGAKEDRRSLQGRANALPQVVDAVLQGSAVRLVLKEGATPPTSAELGDPGIEVSPASP